jgi:hypothetical protein
MTAWLLLLDTGTRAKVNHWGKHHKNVTFCRGTRPPLKYTFWPGEEREQKKKVEDAIQRVRMDMVHFDTEKMVN